MFALIKGATKAIFGLLALKEGYELNKDLGITDKAGKLYDAGKEGSLNPLKAWEIVNEPVRKSPSEVSEEFKRQAENQAEKDAERARKIALESNPKIEQEKLKKIGDEARQSSLNRSYEDAARKPAEDKNDGGELWDKVKNWGIPGLVAFIIGWWKDDYKTGLVMAGIATTAWNFLLKDYVNNSGLVKSFKSAVGMDDDKPAPTVAMKIEGLKLEDNNNSAPAPEPAM